MRRHRKASFNQYIGKLNKPPDVSAITPYIPTILNLHPSFWEVPNFTSWQMFRLNTKYWNYIDHVWTHVIDWNDNYKVFFEEWLPRPGESPFFWIARQTVPKDVASIVHGVKEKIIKNATDAGIAIPEGTIITPVSYTTRFPVTGIFHSIPSKPAFRKFREKGRPQNWAQNLLIYELSQAGMRNMEIARLLFGVKKSTSNYPDKEPILVRINAIKKTAEKAVFQAYPISHST